MGYIVYLYNKVSLGLILILARVRARIQGNKTESQPSPHCDS